MSELASAVQRVLGRFISGRNISILCEIYQCRLGFVSCNSNTRYKTLFSSSLNVSFVECFVVPVFHEIIVAF